MGYFGQKLAKALWSQWQHRCATYVSSVPINRLPTTLHNYTALYYSTISPLCTAKQTNYQTPPFYYSLLLSTDLCFSMQLLSTDLCCFTSLYCSLPFCTTICRFVQLSIVPLNHALYHLVLHKIKPPYRSPAICLPVRPKHYPCACRLLYRAHKAAGKAALCWFRDNNVDVRHCTRVTTDTT